MTWAFINIMSGMTVACIVAYLLGAHGHIFNLFERIGLGLAGSASILTIGPILTRAMIVGASPFDDWSGALLRMGCAVALFGLLGRLEGFAPIAAHSKQ